MFTKLVEIASTFVLMADSFAVSVEALSAMFIMFSLIAA